jgi:predicted Zn finger-like uncharacterized protein
MDVRCEKCQTEYELDESRLKPGGVTVKCTNCGHMFKIRKRTPTNVGLPTVDARTRPASGNQPVVPSVHEAPTVPRQTPNRADSVIGEGMSEGGSGPTTVDRQWLVRLENGEQKTCRELATLQQWIVAGVATRESLISRSGKTWKRLGDISELHQYFVIADEARTQRAHRPTPRPSQPQPMTAAAAGGTILPDDADEDATDRKPTGSFRNRRTTPPPPPPGKPDPRAATELAPTTGPGMRAQTPPPLPGRQTAAWASSEIKQSESLAAMPQGPRGGKFNAAAGNNEPMFAGRVRMDPGDESSFDTGRVRLQDGDDDDMMNPPRGSRAGTWIALASLLVIAAAAGAVYMFVFNKQEPVAAAAHKDAGAIAMATDAGVGSGVAMADAAPAVPADPLDGARAELATGVEPRIKGIYDSLADKTDGPSLGMRARLGAALAQSQLERAGLVTDKGDADKLRKESRQLAIEAAAIAQKALKVKADDATANLAMADVLRLQGKSAKDIDRYLQAAKASAGDPEIAKSIALAAALTDERDGHNDDALKTLAPFASANDPRIQLELALIAYQLGKGGDAKPIVDQLLVASPDHDVARALSKRLETAVVKTDAMPPEDHGSKPPTPHTDPPTNNGGGGGDYDSMVAKANKLAESNCPKAMEMYQKALEQKPTGVEALTGIGYCYLDAKQFSSAFSKFRTALAVSQRYEPALAGIAETYQQQGNKDQAIAAWRTYLDAFPGSAKGKKQLEILGASSDGGPAPTSSGSAAAPAPAPSDGSAAT